MDIRAFSIKLIKKIAMEKNNFFTFEKQGDFFVHTSITKEFANHLEIPVSEFVRKNLFELFKNEEALTRRFYYNLTWKGEETVYQVEHSFNCYCPCYVVLSPVFFNGNVVSVLAHGALAEHVPIQLKDLLKKCYI